MPEEKESRYVPFAFNNNPEALVKGQLDTLKKMEPYKEFVEKLLRDPGKFKVDPELVKQLKLSDPNVQDKLKKWVGDGAKGKPPVSPEQLKRLQDELQKIVKDQPDVGSMPPIPPPIEAPPDVPPPDLDGDARGSLKEIMEKMEESKFGEWLRDSPAWHRAIEDLYRSVRFPRVQPNAGGFERLTRGMFRLDKLPLPNAAALERLGKLKPPSLPRWMPSLPSLPSIGRPSLPSVAPPPMPTAASLGTLAAWLLCLALVALFAWQASKWIKWTDRRRRGAAVDLGPWPVDPQQVATRGTGAGVRPSGTAQARHAGTHLEPQCRGARAGRARRGPGRIGRTAGRLLRVRYTDGTDALSADERDQVRRALTQLAGVAPA